MVKIENRGMWVKETGSPVPGNCLLNSITIVEGSDTTAAAQR